MRLNDYIYIYKIVDGLLIYDRSVSRTDLARAKQRVEELEKLGHEAFFTIGTLTKQRALS